MRSTLSFSIFRRLRVSRIVSRARSQGTLRSEIDILPLTSSPMTTFLLLSAARMRRRFTTSASLKSNEMSRWPLLVLGAAGACAIWIGVAATGRGSAVPLVAPFAGPPAAPFVAPLAAPFLAPLAPFLAPLATSFAGSGVVACATIGAAEAAVGMTIVRPLGSSRIA